MGLFDTLKNIAVTAWEGNPDTAYEMACNLIQKNNMKVALPMMEGVAKSGHVQAQYHLGYLYWEGKLIPQDMAKAEYWLGAAARSGHPEALKFFPAEEEQQTIPGIVCAGCGAALSNGAKFCPECGEKTPQPKCCPSCGVPQSGPAKFCPECGANLNAPPKCSGCGVEMAPEAKFCGECGAKVGTAAPKPTVAEPERNNTSESVTLSIVGPGMEVSCGQLSEEQFDEIMQLYRKGEFENSDYYECAHNYNDVFHLYGVLSAQDGEEIRSPKLSPNYEEIDSYSELEDGVYLIYAAPSRKMYGDFTINCPGGFDPDKLSIQLSSFDFSIIELDDEGTELMGSIISGISYDDEPIELEFEDNGGDCCRFIVRVDDGCLEVLYSQKGDESEWNV